MIAFTFNNLSADLEAANKLIAEFKERVDALATDRDLYVSKLACIESLNYKNRVVELDAVVLEQSRQLEKLGMESIANKRRIESLERDALASTNRRKQLADDLTSARKNLLVAEKRFADLEASREVEFKKAVDLGRTAGVSDSNLVFQSIIENINLDRTELEKSLESYKEIVARSNKTIVYLRDKVTRLESLGSRSFERSSKLWEFNENLKMQLSTADKRIEELQSQVLGLEVKLSVQNVSLVTNGSIESYKELVANLNKRLFQKMEVNRGLHKVNASLLDSRTKVEEENKELKAAKAKLEDENKYLQKLVEAEIRSHNDTRARLAEKEGAIELISEQAAKRFGETAHMLRVEIVSHAKTAEKLWEANGRINELESVCQQATKAMSNAHSQSVLIREQAKKIVTLELSLTDLETEIEHLKDIIAGRKQ